MKLAELKDRLKNKYAVRIVAGVLTIALVGSGVGVYTVSAAKTDKGSKVVETGIEAIDNSDLNVDDILGKISVAKNAVDKEETVYVITDATGKEEQKIVVDHLANAEGKDTITDETTLSDIENVKGNETFEQSGNKLTWQANGNEIYYQGTSTAQAPVTQKVTYMLDGKEVKPEDLAGKSGKVTIRFDYDNTTKYTANVDGEDITVCVPFAAITALTLDDNFSNVEVTNGKLNESGNKNVVLGYALPGLKESLDIDEEKLDADVKIPDYFEITADVENFELSTCMTIVVNASQYISATGSSFDSVDDMLDELTGATDQLIDGSKQLSDGAGTLSDGIGTLQENLKTFADGMGTLTTGLNSYLEGTKQLDSGISTLSDGATSLIDGAGALNTGASQLAAGATSVSDGADAVSAGINTMLTSLPQQMQAGINAMLDTLNTSGFAKAVYASGYSADANGKITVDNINSVTQYVAANEASIEATLTVGTLMAQGYSQEQAMGYIGTNGIPETAVSAYNQALAGLYQGQGAVALYQQTSNSIANNEDIKTLVNGAAALAEGANSLEGGAAQLAAGTQTLVDKIPALTSGISLLKDGSSKLVANNDALKSGASQLANGTTQIVSGVDLLFDGSKKLEDGANQLADGVVEFNEEGITKIINAYDGDLKPLADRLQAVFDAGADYQTYTALSENATGSVKFIYKLGSIKVEE